MIETALVFSDQGKVLHFHEPLGRTSASIPDTRDLWLLLWEHRESLGGIAHTHPFSGPPFPSETDVTTFRAIEKGLGKSLLWPILTYDQIGYWVWNPVRQVYILVTEDYIEVEGLDRLRELSGMLLGSE